MITLLQFPWSPFCITVKRILEQNKIPHRVRNIPSHDRTEVIRATDGRGYTVPCILDGKTVVSDFTDFGQEVARHLDKRFHLGLFPKNKKGIQAILSRYIENDLEGVGFKVNDSYIIPKRPLVERTMLIRHKERKFGKGCIEQWARQRKQMTSQFIELLKPFDNMLADSPFLISYKPLFVDYNLFGVLGNYLYNGRAKFPPLKHLRRWYQKI